MENGNLKQRANLIIEDAEKRLQEMDKQNLGQDETKAQTEWLKLRIFEARTLLSLIFNIEEEDQNEQIRRIAEENLKIVPGRILDLEKNPWSAGLHGDHAETDNPDPKIRNNIRKRKSHSP